MTEGFKALKQTMTDQGGAIVGAINKNGDILCIEIEKNGQVISAQVETSIGALITAMNNNNTKLVDKIGALNTIVETGLGKVEASVDKVTNQLDLQTKAITKLDANLTEQMGDLETALGTLNTTISQGFVAINKTLGGDGTTTVIEAINKNGEILELYLGENGELIKAVNGISGKLDTTNTQLGAVVTAVGKLETKLAGLDNMENLTKAQQDAVKEIKAIKEALEDMLVQQGIYNGTDGNLYMTPSAWKLVSADQTSDLYKSVESAAKSVTPTVTPKPTTSQTTRDYYSLNVQTNAGVPGLVAVNKRAYTEAGTSEQVYKVVNLTCQSMNVKVVALNSSYNIKFSCTDVKSNYSGTATRRTSVPFNVTFLDGETLLENIDVSLTRVWAY